MSDFFGAHQDTLAAASDAIASRTYHSAYPEHPKAYGDEAPAAGQAAFEAMLGEPFETGQPADAHVAVAESSPYGIPLDITYPELSVDDAVARASSAMS